LADQQHPFRRSFIYLSRPQRNPLDKMLLANLDRALLACRCHA